MAKKKDNQQAMQDIINSAKSENTAVKTILNVAPVEETVIEKEVEKPIEKEAKKDIESKPKSRESQIQKNNGFVLKKATKETNTANLPLRLTPTLKSQFEEKTTAEKVSMNEVVRQLIEAWINKDIIINSLTPMQKQQLEERLKVEGVSMDEAVQQLIIAYINNDITIN